LILAGIGLGPLDNSLIDFGPEAGLATSPNGFATVWVIGASPRSVS